MDELLAQAEVDMFLVIALTGAWNRYFFGAHSLSLAHHAYGPASSPGFIRQLEMESNGKRVHLDFNQVTVSTASVLWSGLGIHGQHDYFHLIHPSAHTVLVDFIGMIQTERELSLVRSPQNAVLFNRKVQAQALELLRDPEQNLAALRAEGLSESEPILLCPHRTNAGNIPSSMLWIERLTSQAWGAFVALYMHKGVCLPALWGINPFYQSEVELGKSIVRQMSYVRGE